MPVDEELETATAPALVDDFLDLPLFSAIFSNDERWAGESAQGEQGLIIADVGFEFGSMEFGEFLRVIGKINLGNGFVRPGTFDDIFAVISWHELGHLSILFLHVVTAPL